MYTGRAQLGKFVTLGVQCVASGSLPRRVPSAPDAAPSVTVYDASGNVAVAARPMPAWGPSSATGLFGFAEFLGASYATGSYCARITYAVSSSQMVALVFFHVLSGGDANGAYTSLCYFDRPEVQYLIGQTEGGLFEYKANPSF